MSNANAPAKIFIKVESQAEQNEHLKNARKTFKVLQKSAIPATVIDKENLTGRNSILTRGKTSFNKSKSDEIVLPNQDALKRKKICRSRQTQTESPSFKSPPVVTADDLTSLEKPSENYFEILAQKRLSALEDTLEENKLLYDRIDGLEQELDTSKAMLDEAKNLIEVLTEMLQENEVEQSEMQTDLADQKQSCTVEFDHDDVNQGASTSAEFTKNFDQKSPVKTNVDSLEEHISSTQTSIDSDDD